VLALAVLALAGCAADAADTQDATAAAAASSAAAAASSSAGDAALRAGAALTASGAFDGLVMGTYTCRTTGTTTIVTMTAGATSLVVRAVQGKVVEGAYLTVGKDFGGVVATPGRAGTLAVKGTSATLTGVTIPSRSGGEPLHLDGTVTCR